VGVFDDATACHRFFTEGVVLLAGFLLYQGRVVAWVEPLGQGSQSGECLVRERLTFFAIHRVLNGVFPRKSLHLGRTPGLRHRLFVGVIQTMSGSVLDPRLVQGDSLSFGPLDIVGGVLLRCAVGIAARVQPLVHFAGARGWSPFCWDEGSGDRILLYLVRPVLAWHYSRADLPQKILSMVSSYVRSSL